MTNLSWLVFSGALLLASGASAAERHADTYRLAGIIAKNDNTAVALIEMPDGEQRLLRQGDEIGEGTVADVTAQAVRLIFGDQEFLLRLESSEHESSLTPATYRPSGYAPTEPIALGAAALANLADLAEAGHTVEADKLHARITSELGLPPGTRIMAVDREVVSTPSDALSHMLRQVREKNSQDGMLFRLSVENAGRSNEIYVFRAQAGALNADTATSE